MREPQRRSHMANQRALSGSETPQRAAKWREVQAKAETSEGERNERMLIWTSSGKSEKDISESGGDEAMALGKSGVGLGIGQRRKIWIWIWIWGRKGQELQL